jgi:hypothetical protein
MVEAKTLRNFQPADTGTGTGWKFPTRTRARGIDLPRLKISHFGKNWKLFATTMMVCWFDIMVWIE